MDPFQHLDDKQSAIVNISALTAVGDLERLQVQLHKGLDVGLTVNEIKEILVQLYAYCGFPRSLNGLVTFMAVVNERKAKGIQDPEGQPALPVKEADKYAAGKKNLQVLTGIEEKTPTGANAFAPAIDTFLKEHLFADIFSRGVLDFSQRELVTVAALASMSGVAPQLQAHIGMAMNTGITSLQLADGFLIIDRVVSRGQGDLARATLAKVLAARSADNSNRHDPDAFHAHTQQDTKKYRIAKLEIYPAYLEQYKAALAEHAKAAVAVEPGVIALQAVYDKAHPELVTVFEVYASEEAYQAHLKAPHFLKYKNGTLQMVKSLELIEVAPIAMEMKPGA